MFDHLRESENNTHRCRAAFFHERGDGTSFEVRCALWRDHGRFHFDAAGMMWEQDVESRRNLSLRPQDLMAKEDYPMDGDHVVYTHIGGPENHHVDDLYVGVTSHFHKRQMAHRHSSHWWGEVNFIRTEIFETRAAAEIAEIERISQLEPHHNAHNYRSDPA